MGIFSKKKNVMNVTVDVNRAAEQLWSYASKAYVMEIVRSRALEAVDDAMETIRGRIARNEVQYDWYGRLNNYTFTPHLDEVADFIPEEKLAEFHRASKDYMDAYDKLNKKK